MPILAGIDEAGYGPTLGPLVVTCVAFRTPESDLCLWEALAEAVSRGRAAGGDGAVVCDSKRLYSRARGIGPLEESVLCFLRSRGDEPTDWRALMACLHCEGRDTLNPYPWYEEEQCPVPLSARAEAVARKGARLKRALSDAKVEFCRAHSAPVHVADFNLLVRRTGTKAAVLFAHASVLLDDLWKKFGAEGVHVVLDRQGGRKYYGPALRSVFPDADFRCLVEKAAESTYELSSGRRRMRVSVLTKADQTDFAAALASMCSKYVREVFMEMLNAYWCRRVPGLRPTAGYPVDARRFLGAIEPERKRMGIGMDLVRRIR